MEEFSRELPDLGGAAVRGEAVADSGVLSDLWWEAYNVHRMITEYGEPGLVPINRSSVTMRVFGRAIEAAREICNADVSARAADAPSEPSELDDWTIMQICAAFPTMARSNNMSEIIGFANAVRTFDVKSRVADALDSQPTKTFAPPVLDDASWHAGIKAFRAALNEMTGRDGYVVQETYKAIYASLSSQPTDGGVCNG